LIRVVTIKAEQQKQNIMHLKDDLYPYFLYTGLQSN